MRDSRTLFPISGFAVGRAPQVAGEGEIGARTNGTPEPMERETKCRPVLQHELDVIFRFVVIFRDSAAAGASAWALPSFSGRHGTFS
jgi:hypothetical protein